MPLVSTYPSMSPWRPERSTLVTPALGIGSLARLGATNMNGPLAGGRCQLTRGTSATGGSTIGRILGMAKEKISVTVDATVLAATDADARAAGLNRSEMVEQALRNEHLRVALQNYTTQTVPALDIDAYAQKVYQANRAAGL